MPIKLKIDVTKLDKSAFFRSEKTGAIYAELVAWETTDSQYGDDYRIVQDLPRERRDAGEKGAIVGNAKNFGKTQQERPPQRKEPPVRKPARDPDLDATEDDIPF